MNTGQMSMMPANTGVPIPNSAQALSPATALPGSGGRAGGLFIGLLEGMTPRNTTQGAAVPVSDGKDVSASGNNDETASTAVLQDDAAGLTAGLLNAGVRTTTTGSDKKPQDVALNADGLQMALLIQVNSGRMPQVTDTVEQQTLAPPVMEGIAESPAPTDASDKKPQDVALNTDGLMIVQMIQANSGRMLQAVDAPATDAPLEGLSAEPSLLATAPKGNGSHQASQEAPAEMPAQPTLSSLPQASAIVGQKDQVAGSDMVTTERGKTPSGQNGSTGGADVPVSPSVTLGEGVAEAAVQPRQEVTLFRSANLEVALAESAPLRETHTPGQAQDQNTQVEEVSAAPTEKVPQTSLQQDTRPVKSNPMAVPVTLSQASSQQPDHVATNNQNLEVTKSAQATVAPASAKTGAEAGGQAVQTQPESTVVTKPVQNVAVEAAKFTGAGPSGEEFGTGDDKGTADSFMNGQFHTTLMHQQGGTDGANAVSSAATPVQNNAQQVGLPEQILQQVKDRLANHEVKSGNDQIVLKLSPENLGDLKVNLAMDGQHLKVEIVAENHMVRDALLKNTDSLKESLARQNISMESFNVTTNGRGAGNPGQGQQQNGWREFAQQKQQNAWMQSGGYRLPEAASVPSQVAYQRPSPHTMVDLHF